MIGVVLTTASARRAAASSPPVGRRERNKREKRKRIIEAARELFSSQGFEGTTTAEIAARADVAAGTLFLYVASKEDLLVLVFREEMDRVADEAFSSLPGGASLLDELVHVYGALIALHGRDRGLARVFVKELMFVGDTHRANVEAFVDGLVDRTAERIERGQRAGAFHPGAPARAIAENCFRLYIAMLQRWLGLGGHVASEEHIARLRAALELQLRGFELH